MGQSWVHFQFAKKWQTFGVSRTAPSGEVNLTGNLMPSLRRREAWRVLWVFHPFWHFNCSAFKHTCSMVTRFRMGNMCCRVPDPDTLMNSCTVEQSTKRRTFYNIYCNIYFVASVLRIGRKNGRNKPYSSTSNFLISQLRSPGRNTFISVATFRWHDFPSFQMLSI